MLLLPVGVLGALVCARIGGGRSWRSAGADGLLCLAGWCLVVAAEGVVYLFAAGDLLLRLRVIQNHYGTLDSIARAGLNTDARTIPFSVLPPLLWWQSGGWGHLNQDQAYHALLFCWGGLALIAGLAAIVWRGELIDRRARAGMALAWVWLLWPLLYHQFGTQSLTHFVPIHRLSRHLVVYAPGAIFAVASGCAVCAKVVRASRRPFAPAAAWGLALTLLLVHLDFNWQGERVAFESYHRIKDGYIRIRAHLPQDTRTIAGDPGDLCFFDFWMNPLGVERVRMVPFAAYTDCSQIQDAVVLTQSNPGWLGGAPVILDTVRRLPCLTRPPVSWRLLYGGYPEKVYDVALNSHATR